MKVLLVSPTVPPARTGNARTVERWALALEERGHETLLVAATELDERGFAALVAREPFDVIHLHHAIRSGRFVDEARARAAVVVSFAGTDLASLPSGEGAAIALRAA